MFPVVRRSDAAMNYLLRAFVGAVLLAALGLCRESPAQEHGDKALQRARVIEEQEGDLKAAEKAYRELVDAAGTADGVRNDAMLRLGRMLWRLGREPDARVLLQRSRRARATRSHGGSARSRRSATRSRTCSGWEPLPYRRSCVSSANGTALRWTR
jgi:hypothetical protein